MENEILIIQQPISDKHKSAMFIFGVIATYGEYRLATYQSGEIIYNGHVYSDRNICKLGRLHVINDDDIDSETDVTILVDRFIYIFDAENNEMFEDYCEDNYDGAIAMFKKFVKDLN